MPEEKKKEKVVRLQPARIKAGTPAKKSPRREKAQKEVDKYFAEIKRQM